MKPILSVSEVEYIEDVSGVRHLMEVEFMKIELVSKNWLLKLNLHLYG